jgi:hypothetical protein
MKLTIVIDFIYEYAPQQHTQMRSIIFNIWKNSSVAGEVYQLVNILQAIYNIANINYNYKN